MENDLKKPSDRRLAGETKDLPPGPPGAENDDEYGVKKKEKNVLKESFKSRRRSPSGSPPSSKRKSPSKGSHLSPRGRRTPSPRRRFGRNRNGYSPERRRYNDRGRIRRTPTRNRSRDRIDNRRNGRDRFRGRRDSRSRSNSPVIRRRWSPKQKPASPPIPPPDVQYSVTGSGMYSDAYTGYTQYGPSQQSYGSGDFVGAQPQSCFNTGYPPPPAWGIPADNYQSTNWVSQPEPLPPTIIQSQLSGVVVPQPVPVQTSIKKKVEINPTHDALAQEAENQRGELKKQRTSYLKKTSALKKELKVLKEQRKDLIGGSGSHSPTTKGFLDENERLQNQIQRKLSTIENVIDMLTGIIGEENLSKGDAMESPKKQTKKKNSSSSSSSDGSTFSESSSSSSSSSSSESEDNSSPERLKSKAIQSMKKKRDNQGKAVEKKISEATQKSEEKRINYVFYDPETHWCKMCKVFPKTAKDYLTHLHSKDHGENIETMETPWHNEMTTNEYPSYEGAPTKRIPIRGLSFFVPATSWFCKICSDWMGDLHCASLHLKSQTHSNNYNAFLEKNPHYEVDWLTERQKLLNEKKTVSPQGPQINALHPTTNNETKNKFKHVEDKEKSSKTRKKKNSEKKDKKKKKRQKKRKKAASSSSNYSSSEPENKKKKKQFELQLNAELSAPSIRVQMRNFQNETEEIEIKELAPPPPPKISELNQSNVHEMENKKKDDLISQWNIVESVISDSEKKLLEQLKGKLKNRPTEKKEEKIVLPPAVQNIKINEKKSSTEHKERLRSPTKGEGGNNEKGRDYRRGVEYHRRSGSRPSRRSRSLSANRGRRIERSRSRGVRLHRSRSRGRRTPNRSRYSPRVYGRRRRSRSQTKRRSRSQGRVRHRFSSSRSRSRSSSTHRIEKAIVRQPEFRPRIPVTDANSIKKNKMKHDEEKEERKKISLKSSTSNKKFPFIGRMPVFKKQSQNSENNENSENEKKEEQNQQIEYNLERGPLSLMQDSCVHAGYEHSLMSEYEDLMPDPVQFVSLMGAPPPPPSKPPPQQFNEEEKDILPPGIDETESEFVPKPINDAPIPRKGPLPKDFEEALNIIFPGEKKYDDTSVTTKNTGETQIIIDKPVMQRSDLIKEGIHIMTVEETSLVGLDEASQMSMNEPLQFNKPTSSLVVLSASGSGESSVEKSPIRTEKEAVSIYISTIPPPPPAVKETSTEFNIDCNNYCQPHEITKDIKTSSEVLNRPFSPTDSEKQRRQEELDDLAMLGIDADDMAAMCI